MQVFFAFSVLRVQQYLFNVTDKNIILQSEQEIATVEEAQVLCAETELKAPKPRVSKKTNYTRTHRRVV
jgi:hypothetical protein